MQQSCFLSTPTDTVILLKNVGNVTCNISGVNTWCNFEVACYVASDVALCDVASDVALCDSASSLSGLADEVRGILRFNNAVIYLPLLQHCIHQAPFHCSVVS